MKKFIILLGVLSTIIFSQNSGVFNKVRERYANASGFEVQISVSGLQGGGGKLYYKKENKTRIELNNLLIITDGKSTWTLQKSQKKMMVSSFDPNDNSLLTFNKIINYYPSVSDITETVEGGKPVITLTSKKNTTPFSKIICTVNKDNIIEKVILIDRGGNKQSVTFSGWKFNTPDDSYFAPGDTKGVKVIDLR